MSNIFLTELTGLTGLLIMEYKSVQAIGAAHEVQLVNYLTATGIEVGLLLNFGSPRLEIKRKTRTYRPKSPAYPVKVHEKNPVM